MGSADATAHAGDGSAVNNRFSELFIRRPVATILLTIGIVFGGLLGYSQLPVSPLPQVDFPIISVQANMPGASPDTMATSVAAPLERHLGQIADVNEMTSQSTLGSTRITLQFGLDRNIDGAARDVQAAIVAARADLPTSLRQNPTYHKVNPADAPIMVIAHDRRRRTRRGSSMTSPPTFCSSGCRSFRASARSMSPARAAGGARRDQPRRDLPLRHRARGHPRRARLRQRQQPEGRDRGRRLPLSDLRQRSGVPRRAISRSGDRLSQRRAGQARRCRRSRRIRSRTCATPALSTASRGSRSFCRASRAPTSSRRSTTFEPSCRA